MGGKRRITWLGGIAQRRRLQRVARRGSEADRLRCAGVVRESAPAPARCVPRSLQVDGQSGGSFLSVLFKRYWAVKRQRRV